MGYVVRFLRYMCSRKVFILMKLLVVASLTFPLWIRVTHYINILFLFFMIRSGIQILAAHPRLYWTDSSDPKTAWLKFTRKQVPKDQLYTAADSEIEASPWLALPGGGNLGLGRHWHFFSLIFWILNGVVYVALLFLTGEWSRLIPTSWDIFPHAWESLVTYVTLHVPPESAFRPYDGLQQLTYAGVVFLLTPFMILLGAAMSPSIEAHYPWYVRLFGGKQGARSLHFLGMVAFTLFVVVHVTLVLVVHFQDNIRNIVLGSSQGSVSEAVILAIIALLVIFAIHVWATLYTRGHLRQMQQVLGRVADPLYTFFLARQSSNQNYTPAQITPYFWINGRPPETEEYKQEVAHTFADYKLEVSGLCARSLHLSLEDIHRLPQQEQITLHNCIQGWSGIAKWTGVPLTEILTLCEPSPRAKYVVFWSYQTGKEGYKHVPEEKQNRFFYETLSLDIVKHPQTILAYAMNDTPLTIEHGAPLRLRCETQLGFKMVKYLRKIELVEEYSHIYDGQGGFREDIQYFAMEAGI